MSNLIATTLAGQLTGDNLIKVASGSVFKYPGAILQTLYIRSDNRAAWASPATGDGITITDLNITIAPKLSSSILLITWMINGEMAENNVFLVHENGVLITASGYEAYNTVSGNVNYSGVVSAKYDADNGSTPNNYCLQYYILAGSTASRTYAPAVRSTSGAAQTFFLNRPTGSVGADGNENTISTGVIMEIAQ